jgi:hypothetical protein
MGPKEDDEEDGGGGGGGGDDEHVGDEIIACNPNPSPT